MESVLPIMVCRCVAEWCRSTVYIQISKDEERKEGHADLGIVFASLVQLNKDEMISVSVFFSFCFLCSSAKEMTMMILLLLLLVWSSRIIQGYSISSFFSLTFANTFKSPNVSVLEFISLLQWSTQICVVVFARQSAKKECFVSAGSSSIPSHFILFLEKRRQPMTIEYEWLQMPKKKR